MTDHTPGPWGIVFHDDVERIRLNGSSVYQVADVTDPDFPTGKPRYNLADLRLMAAAPELLRLLREGSSVVSSLEAGLRPQRTRCWRQSVDKLFDKLEVD
jgi:hypothetical protein